ncbi:unnamed protein product [Cuscuta campestris]|uniref:BZIP domain-containing protein n=1 Tax=Cuscuta campestris TaxID=132261 RepID=A0A484N279_9ASTE|nr:unnamed protein product [Cuscuta campestris]
MAISFPSCSLMLGGDQAGSSQRAFSERPHSPPVVTYEVATEGRSTRFNIPTLSLSLGDMQLETLVTLPAQDRARICAGSEDDLNNIVLLKPSQTAKLLWMKRGRRRKIRRESCRRKSLASRELEEEKGRFAVLETKNASISSELGSVPARVTELEVERSDQARHMEEAIESLNKFSAWRKRPGPTVALGETAAYSTKPL